MTEEHTSAAMSSPASRRSNRNRQSATPVRSTLGNNQETNLEEPRAQTTPRASRQAPPASSPLFYGSSPLANGGNRPDSNERMDSSTPLLQTSFADRESTPRPRAPPPGGKSITFPLRTQSDDRDFRLVASKVCLKLKPWPRSRRQHSFPSRYPDK